MATAELRSEHRPSLLLILSWPTLNPVPLLFN